jgi:glycosyltransferase involved in cell wall biosynthesis
MRRLLVVNNIPTPYRAAMFNRLSDLGRERAVELFVAFQARREARRPWRPEDLEMRFPHSIFPGLAVSRRDAPRDVFRYSVVNPGILRLVREGGFDWVVMAPLMSVTGWIASFVPLTSTRRLLWCESNLVSARRSSAPARWFKRQLLRRWDGLVCPGERAVEYIATLAPEMRSRPVLWLPNVVDASLYGDRVAALRRRRGAIRAALGAASRTRLVLCVGQLVQSKGFARVIEAVAAVAGDYRILIAGAGPLETELRARIATLSLEHQIELVGLKDADELAHLLAAADWFLHPATADPSPLVTIEAITAGLPVAVSWQTGNAPEVVVAGRNGFVFDGTNTEEVADALRTMLDVPEEVRRSMAIESEVLAKERFDTGGVLGRFLDALCSLRSEGSVPVAGRRVPSLDTEEWMCGSDRLDQHLCRPRPHAPGRNARCG